MDRRSVLRGMAALPAAAAVVGLGAGTARADGATVVDPASNRGTWEGWGTSLSWWAKAVGPDPVVADALFGRGSVQLLGQTLPGLGLNIVRYNVGGSSTHAIDGRAMRPEPSTAGYKALEGYQLDWFSSDPSSSSWDWYADANQRDMMWLARDRGADTFEMFSNSPMWWMLENDDPRGSETPWHCNLQDGNYGRHAAYLATVARYAHDHWGIDFRSVQPVNEPCLPWTPEEGRGQEGCFYTPAQQARLIAETRAQLDARGLAWMEIPAMDENGYDYALDTWNRFDPATRQTVGRINVHGYRADTRRDLLYDAAVAAGKRIWMSEYTDVDGSGMTIARNLGLDMRWLHPTAWVYWQVVDNSNGGGWGPIELVDNRLGLVNTKYYVLAQYTRHIRPGMRILDTGTPDVVAAYDSAARKLVIVAANHDTDRYLDFDLSRFTTAATDGALVDRWMTATAGSERYAHHQDTFLHGRRFWSWFPARSVQSFEVTGVDL
ncbi:glycoside hydrolase [Streptomyces sp. NPDC058740]|uniref:glycoside hydrolase n=1 Tax=unclassified Streptomyces TaxID=2593676 RepID=UPI0036B4C830